MSADTNSPFLMWANLPTGVSNFTITFFCLIPTTLAVSPTTYLVPHESLNLTESPIPKSRTVLVARIFFILRSRASLSLIRSLSKVPESRAALTASRVMSICILSSFGRIIISGRFAGWLKSWIVFIKQVHVKVCVCTAYRTVKWIHIIWD